MHRPSPKPVKTYFGGEAAKSRTPRPRTPGEQFYSSQKRRQSDGPPSKVLHVYRLRSSVTEKQVRALFEPYGQVDRVLLYKPQFAYVVFKWVSDAAEAKQDLDLRKKGPDGSYIDVVLRDVQFVRHTSGQGMKLANRPYDVLRIDFCDPALALPPCVASSSTDAGDDFHDDSVFNDTQVIAALSVAP
ncbi:hypothetical protein AAVH_10947 [Aphelenchoides avenae]|nr:hypothetical protein AAVH_10947 [Aphelenchus avenae]